MWKKLCWKCKIWHYSIVSLLFSHWRPLLIHFHSIITSLSLNCAFVIVVLLLFLIRLLVCYFGTESWKSPLALKSCKICNPRAHLSQDPVPTKICCHGNNIRPAPVHERPKAPPLLLNRFVFEDPKNNVTHVNALSMAQCWALQCYLLSIHPSIQWCAQSSGGAGRNDVTRAQPWTGVLYRFAPPRLGVGDMAKIYK